MTAALGSRVRTSAGSLPADATSFLGRRREISDVKRLLPEFRVVTLTGPGGVGKTRLALRIAADVRRSYHDNVFFIELADLRDPSLLANTVAERLGLHDQSARPAIDTIINHLGDRHTLLVLDNCEHLIDECAALVSTLVRSCPGLRVLATSRQSLGLLGESTFPVPPLPLPGPDLVQSPSAIAQYDSVRLFVERASAVIGRFELTEDNYEAVARLCQELDGMPLAIELTVVRLRSLSLDQILRRLSERYLSLGGGTRGTPTRQRTLRALIDWSYELCTEQEKQVWSRASVFSGSFSLDAVEQVTSGYGLATSDVLGIVESLVDKSIFLREQPGETVYYRLLETMREYGEEKLVEAGDRTRTLHRHRDWYTHLTQRFADEWIGPDQAAWIRRLRHDHPNLRVALDFCATEPGEGTAGLGIAAGLHEYWSIRGFHTEARHWLDRLLPTAQEPTHERVEALRVNAWFALMQRDLDQSRRQLAEASEVAEQIGDAIEDAYLRHIPGAAALFTGDMDRAAELLSDALSRFQEGKVLRGELFTLFHLGLTLGILGDRERGVRLLNDNLAKTAELGEVYWRSWAYWALAFLRLLHETPDRAEEAGKEALRLQQTLGNRFTMAFTIETLAWIAGEREKHTRAAELFGAASALWHEIGNKPDNFAPVRDGHYRYLARITEVLGEKTFESCSKRGRAMPLGSAIDYALGTERGDTTAASSEEAPESPLTKREQQIAELVAEGMTNREIAGKLVISLRTADAHVEHILTKLGFHSRTQIATWITTGGTQ